MQVMEGVVPRLAAVQASAQIYILLKSGNLCPLAKVEQRALVVENTMQLCHYVTT